MEMSTKDITNIANEIQRRKYTKEFFDITIYNVQTQDMNLVSDDLVNINKVMKKDSMILLFTRSKNLMDLVLVSDSIFGKENRQEFISIAKPMSSQNDKYGIQSNNYFAVIYLNGDVGSCMVKNTYVKSKVYRNKNDNNMTYTKGSGITTRKSGGTLYARKNLGATIYYNPDSGDIQIREDYNKNLIQENSKEEDIYTDCETLIENGYEIIRPNLVRDSLGCWTWSTDKLESNKDDLMIYKFQDRYLVRKKKYISQDRIFKEDGEEFVKELKQMPIKSFYTEESYLEKEEAILGDSKYVFSIELIQDLLNSLIIDSNDGNITVLSINNKNMRIKNKESFFDVSIENRKNIEIEVETVEYMR